MRRLIIVILSTIFSVGIFAQELQVQTFGNEKNDALIFLHGGPGYNSVSFEQTTAKELAKAGFFVISYDRRGEGRNENLQALYTFEKTLRDLLGIYRKYKLKNAILVGHSFGGVIGSLFAEKYPEKVADLVLVSTPISMQKTLKNIIEKSKSIYESKNDKLNLRYISMLEKMDKTSLEYSSYCLMHAMANGFYATKKPNERATELYKIFKTDTLLRKYSSKMNYFASKGFWENEKYTSISLIDTLSKLKKQKIPIFAIYGQEDGLFSEKQIADLRHILGKNNVEYWENCSHNIFIDQQSKFINFIRENTK